MLVCSVASLETQCAARSIAIGSLRLLTAAALSISPSSHPLWQPVQPCHHAAIDVRDSDKAALPFTRSVPLHTGPSRDQSIKCSPDMQAWIMR